MKETFESNLSSSQKEELQSEEDFANLKAAKTTEMEKAQAMVDSKTQELATTVEANESAKQDKADTEADLAADTKFLEDLKVRCKNADEEHAMFGKTLGFLQMSSETRCTNSRR